MADGSPDEYTRQTPGHRLSATMTAMSQGDRSQVSAGWARPFTRQFFNRTLQTGE